MNDMIICIGRQYGSGGREIGEKLAARLGVTCYDKLLLKQAAKEGGVSLGEVERQDEKPVSASASSRSILNCTSARASAARSIPRASSSTTRKRKPFWTRRTRAAASSLAAAPLRC